MEVDRNGNISAWLEEAIAQLGNLPSDESLQTLRDPLTQLSNSWIKINNSGGPEEQANQYPALRFQLHKLTDIIEELQSQWADRYRMQAGENKDQFEELTDSLQQQTNPIAYESKMTFHVLDQIKDRLSEIGAELMDMRGQVEHQAVEQLRNQADIGSVPDYDNDPAKSSLSP
jgi:hypothetical protein